MFYKSNHKNTRGLFFFVPIDLVKLEYLGVENENAQINEKSKRYEKERTLAFFVVNFGYTKKEFEQLTKLEIQFILKAWENKLVLETQLMANAFLNSHVNACRKKGKKIIPLWKKNKKKSDVVLLKKQYENILEHEKTQSRDWVFKLYESR